MKIAYMRVSSVGQSLAVQESQVKERNPDKIYKEKLSATKERPELEKILGNIQKGDILLVTKLDRLARSITDLFRIIGVLESAEASLEIINCGGLDISGAIGKLIITILGGVAAFENDIRRERQKEGILLAKMRGTYKNREQDKKRAERKRKKAVDIIRLRKSDYSGRRIAELVKCSPRLVRTVLRENGIPTETIIKRESKHATS